MKIGSGSHYPSLHKLVGPFYCFSCKGVFQNFLREDLLETRDIFVFNGNRDASVPCKELVYELTHQMERSPNWLHLSHASIRVHGKLLKREGPF